MNPYQQLPEKAFWKTAVAEKDFEQISQIWQPKFTFNKKHRIVTAGSCFAQHISRSLIKNEYTWLDAEPAPIGLNAQSKSLFNYGIFSFRTGNIYTVALLKQWVQWALTDQEIPNEIWLKDGRYYDPFRPNIEPNGFASAEELLASRKTTLLAIKDALSRAYLFIFTLGLTEAWLNKEQGYVYPMCPGTVAGEFDAQQHEFINYSYAHITKDLNATLILIKKINPRIKFLLTVSPVPLTATASKEHVLVATYYSKSILRAVAGDMANRRADTDYFPSYELISSFPSRGAFYKNNLRQVTDEGVDFVMSSFFACLGKPIKKEAELRAVAGDVANRRADTDYSPSYESISSFPSRGAFYKNNLRQVIDKGVDFVMSLFFTCLGKPIKKVALNKRLQPVKPILITKQISNTENEAEALVCEEELLNAFSTGDKQ